MVSILIPCYEMKGRGKELLEYNLQKILNQKYKDLEVVVSDQSQDDIIEKVCDFWKEKININYYKITDKLGNPAYNINRGISYCKGDIIKFLFQDDYFYDEDSLSNIVKAFDSGVSWVMSEYIHTMDKVNYFRHFKPEYHPRIYLKNTIGAPSGIAIRNNNPIFFDENVRWVFDCEYYKRLYDKFGMPGYVPYITAVIYLWEGQLSNQFIDFESRRKEKEYVAALYGTTVQDHEWN